MPAEINVAFWNVQNLFPPAVVDRGPATEAELEAKIAALAAVINGLFGNQGPDLLGLAEIHNEAVFNVLSSRLSGQFRHIWEPATRDDQTGIGVLARKSVIDDFTLLDVQRPETNARPRCLITSCRISGTVGSFLFVVNHWKSRRGLPSAGNADRQETADWLGNYLSNISPIDCAIVIGDFNAEPFESPFCGHLRGRRTFRGAFSAGEFAQLYNCGWRFLAEHDLWEVASMPEFQQTRPTSSHGESGDALFDFLLLSKRALQDGAVTLREGSVRFECTPETARRNKYGVLRPRSWAYDSAGAQHGTSDHFPLVASFVVSE